MPLRLHRKDAWPIFRYAAALSLITPSFASCISTIGAGHPSIHDYLRWESHVSWNIIFLETSAGCDFLFWALLCMWTLCWRVVRVTLYRNGWSCKVLMGTSIWLSPCLATWLDIIYLPRSSHIWLMRMSRPRIWELSMYYFAPLTCVCSRISNSSGTVSAESHICLDLH